MRRLFYAVVALQMLFLLGEAGRAHLILVRSPLVTLKVVPVDPRSLFMGNYIDLSYDISTIDLTKVRHYGPELNFHSGNPIYVGLIPGKPWASISIVRVAEPEPGDKTLYLRGEIGWTSGHRINVEYGLERYYIPETKQEAVNRMSWRPNTRMTVEVAVPESRRGIIRRVLVNGRPLGF